MLENKFSERYNFVKSSLAEVEFISFTTDMWKNKKGAKSFLRFFKNFVAVSKKIRLFYAPNILV